MRSINGQFSKGFTGNPNGRPKRADESFLVDLWESDGQKIFSKAVREERQWALKILIDKLYPNKKEAYLDVEVETSTKSSLSTEEANRLMELIV